MWFTYSSRKKITYGNERITNNVFKKGNYPTSWGGDGATRCTDSYIVSKKCSKKLLEYFYKDSKINLPIDWYLNKIIRDLKLNIYWAEPTIVTQGTQNGTWNTSY